MGLFNIDRDSFVLNGILDGQTITSVSKAIGVCSSAAREIMHRQVKTVMPELYGVRKHTLNPSYPELHELRALKDEIKSKIVARLESMMPKVYEGGSMPENSSYSYIKTGEELKVGECVLIKTGIQVRVESGEMVNTYIIKEVK